MAFTEESARKLAGLLRKGKPHKYGVASSEKRTFQGVLYHSAAEARYARMLSLAQRAGSVEGWRRQVPFPIRVEGGEVLMVVRIDFAVKEKGYRERYVEVKGKETERWKLNLKALKLCYPQVVELLTIVRA